MIDYRRRGNHIQVKHYLQTLTHTFRGGERGVVLGETNRGLGDDRRIVSVEWECGVDLGPVFSDEIEAIPA
jgi:hypothetical protein